MSSKELVEKRSKELEEFFRFHASRIGIILLGNDRASLAYVNAKSAFGKKIGVDVVVHHHDENFSLEDTLLLIDSINNDPNYHGVMVQLPLPKHLSPYKEQILGQIATQKDIDVLKYGISYNYGSTPENILPATAEGVIDLLNFYGFSDVTGKKIAMIGMSNLVGKPLYDWFFAHGGIVQGFTIENTSDEIKSFCKQADFILSATGAVKSIDKNHIGDQNNQVIIDIGRGRDENNRISGDVNFEEVAPFVKTISPVPGGAGGTTVVNLFLNLKKLIQRTKLFGEENI